MREKQHDVQKLEILTIENERDALLLHQISKVIPIADITSKTMRTIVRSMIRTAEMSVSADGYQCVGLSAVQVGLPIRLFIKMNMNDREFYPYFNPEFEIIGNEYKLGFETCMSIPHQRIEVNRALKIKLTYYDSDGKKQEHIYEKFPARIVQHEIDHLNGQLITD